MFEKNVKRKNVMLLQHPVYLKYTSPLVPDKFLFIVRAMKIDGFALTSALNTLYVGYILCYKQADQQSLDWVQVKAHDRAFVASKAFYGGVLVDQIMQTCHWKAHTHLQLFT